MDLEQIIKRLQTWTNSVPLIILGSGASVPFGIPSMLELGNFLKDEISFTDTEDQTQFETFKTNFDSCKDLESTLLDMQLRKSVSNEIIVKTWELINNKDLELYENLLQENDNFPLSQLITYLLSTTKQKVSIVTTNYDRLAEYATNLANAFICNGFSQNFFGHFSNTIHKNDFTKTQGFAGQVNIWKVHGSLDWFKSNDDVDFNFPLRKQIPNNYIPSIVTPGIDKYYQTHLEPFRTIFTESDNEIQKANGFFCIGYGFNDKHVQPKLITQIKNGKPIIVITKKLTAKTKEAVINNSCKNYILFEQANDNDTRIYTPDFSKGEIIEGQSYWRLEEYLKLINRKHYGNI